VCIIGCGAVGSLFAAHLAQKGEAEVCAYDVWKDHIEAIRPTDRWAIPAVGDIPASAALLIRPDGYVAWLPEAAADLHTALTIWFGPNWMFHRPRGAPLYFR